MTPEEFYNAMIEINKKCMDEGEAHAKMDDLMCHLLFSLGYSAGVEVFKTTPMYYYSS